MIWAAGLIVVAFVCWRGALAWQLRALDRRLAARGWPRTLEALNAWYKLEPGEENATGEILAAGAAFKKVEKAAREEARALDPVQICFAKIEALDARETAGEVSSEDFRLESERLNDELLEAMEAESAKSSQSIARLKQIADSLEAKKPIIADAELDEFLKTPTNFLKDDIPDDAPPLSEEWRCGIADAVGRHAQLLPHLERAAAIGTARYPVDFTKWPDSCGTLHDAWSPLRDGSCLLQRSAILQAEAGDREGAIRNLERIFRLAQTLERQPTVMSQIVWAVLHSTGLKGLHYILNRCALEPAQLARLDALLARSAQNDTYAVAWAGESCVIRPGFWLDASRDDTPPDDTHASEEFGDCDSDDHDPKTPDLKLPLDHDSDRWPLYSAIPYKILGLETLDCLLFMRSVEAGLQVAKGTPAQKMNWLRRTGKTINREPRFRLRASKGFMVDPASSLISTFLLETRIATARTALAVELYRIDHGALPESLSHLPGEVPIDCFSGEPLQYERLEYGYVVSSAGFAHEVRGKQKRQEVAFRVRR